MLARVGFLPPDDPRIVGTVEAIERELVVDGFVLRYLTGDDDAVDGLPPGEGTFLMTTFWLADNLALIGRARRGPRRVRAAPGAEQRRRAARRGVRPEGAAHARQLPAGVLAPGVRHHGRAPLDGRRVADLETGARGNTADARSSTRSRCWPSIR